MVVVSISSMYNSISVVIVSVSNIKSQGKWMSEIILGGEI